MSSKSTNQVFGKSIASTDSQLEDYLSAIAGVVYQTEATVIDFHVNEGDTSEETLATNVMLFEAGESSHMVTVDVIGEIGAEPTKTITVTLSNPEALSSLPNLTASSDTTTILDDETWEILSLIQLI
ncbi:MAG: hypothetical protein MUE44_33085 [Oscillatoriaceae cyanobacterium Prado104]|jgi:hypothetical protein|nr:hypothetical protein [Oscillatoriaceae cyanobacterium Prado104]